MDQKPISNLMAGLVLAAILIIYSLVLYFAGLELNTALSLATYVLLIAGLIIYIRLYGKSKAGQVVFGQLFGYGFRTTLVITSLFIVFLIVLNLIFPEMKQKVLDMARQRLEAMGRYSEDQIDQAIEINRKGYLVFQLLGTIFGFMIAGALASLIGAAITKKTPVSPFQANQ
jgi:hypothetical protein